MTRRSHILAGAFALAGLLLASGATWAASPAARAAARQTVEQRLTSLQERIAQVQPSTPLERAHLMAARILATQAQQLASRNQDSAARLNADSAERLLARAEGKGLMPVDVKEVLK